MRRINQCLNSRLIDICQRTVQLETLNITLSSYLPETLKNHCKAGSFSKGCLIIIVNDPVWASQLRYALPELRDKLRRDGGLYQLSSIKISLAMNDQPAVSQKTPHHVLSSSAKASISAGAELCEYLPLKNALQHLAQGNDSETT